MKKLSAVMVTGIFLVLTGIHAIAQSAAANASLIEPYHLSVTFYKTTNLVFPYAIKSVDKGSKDVLAQKAKGVENILQVKAGKVNFAETNLTVITADGKLYSYIVNYASSPSVLNIDFTGSHSNNADTFFSTATSDEAVIETDAKRVAEKKRTLYGVEDKKYGMKLSLIGLFIRNEMMYYQIKIENNSSIGYDIEQLRFFIKEQNTSERTASQELEIKPIYVSNNTSTVSDYSEQVIVFALTKFTIPDRKLLAVQLMEKEGGRHLSLSVKNRLLMRAKLIA